jgi:hypothetical protein
MEPLKHGGPKECRFFENRVHQHFSGTLQRPLSSSPPSYWEIEHSPTTCKPQAESMTVSSRLKTAWSLSSMAVLRNVGSSRIACTWDTLTEQSAFSSFLDALKRNTYVEHKQPAVILVKNTSLHQDNCRLLMLNVRIPLQRVEKRRES